MKPAAFIETYTSAIVNSCQGTGIFPSVKMAQMGLESAWGASFIGNNAFGIKAAGAHSPFWQGASVNAQNNPSEGGRSNYRAYKSVQDSISDHTYFLQQNQRYTTHGVFSATTPEQQAYALKAAGYATAEHYAPTLIKIINDNNLRVLDSIIAKPAKAIVPVLLIAIAAFGIYKIWKK